MALRERILGTSAGYWAMKRAFAADSANARIAREYIRAGVGERILDVGCGVGDLASHLEPAEYVGVDSNGSYIARARQRARTNSRFIEASVEELPDLGLEQFDKVTIVGVLHHLSDEQVRGLMTALPAVMKPDAQLIVAENAWSPEQATTARVLIALDRGRHVRSVDGYERLIEPHFHMIESELRHDLLRIPYTYVITTARVRPDS